MRAHLIVCYIDGLCEPAYEGGPQNPGGIATYGYVVLNGHKKAIARRFGIIGEGPLMSNNVAEYAGLCRCLRFLLKRDANLEDIEIKSDSKLVVNQMKGIWKVHGGLYTEKHLEAKRLSQRFKNLSFTWIPRELNEEADALSRKAYESAFRSRI